MYRHNIEILQLAEEIALNEQNMREVLKIRKSLKIKLARANNKYSAYREGIINKYGEIPQLKHLNTEGKIRARIREGHPYAYIIKMIEENRSANFYNACNTHIYKINEDMKILNDNVNKLYSDIYKLPTKWELTTEINKLKERMEAYRKGASKFNIKTEEVVIEERIENEPFEYFNSTKAEWIAMELITPKQYVEACKHADFISPSGSCYFYHKNGIVRISDHWGERIASCYWTLKNNELNVSLNGEAFVIAFCKWEDFDQSFVQCDTW